MSVKMWKIPLIHRFNYADFFYTFIIIIFKSKPSSLMVWDKIKDLLVPQTSFINKYLLFYFHIYFLLRNLSSLVKAMKMLTCKENHALSIHNETIFNRSSLFSCYCQPNKYSNAFEQPCIWFMNWYMYSI